MLIKKILYIGILLTTLTHAQTPQEAFESLPKAPYAFTFCDLGITQEDLDIFNSIIIKKTDDHNQFGDFEHLKENIKKFLHIVSFFEFPFRDDYSAKR